MKKSLLTKKNIRSLAGVTPPLPAPEPVPNVETYRHELELRLDGYPSCRENYDKYLRSNRHQEKLDFLPIKLDIENVSRCNFRCKMCQVSEWPKGRRSEDMSLDQFKELIDEQVVVLLPLVIRLQ